MHATARCVQQQRSLQLLGCLQQQRQIHILDFRKSREAWKAGPLATAYRSATAGTPAAAWCLQQQGTKPHYGSQKRLGGLESRATCTHCNSRDFSISVVPATVGVSATTGSKAILGISTKACGCSKTAVRVMPGNSRDKIHLLLERPENAGTKRIQQQQEY
jgi:hypothetical protein